MRKMCKWATQDCMGLKYKYMFKSCPKNSNHLCEMVPPKSRVKRIKAWFWACIDNDTKGMIMAQNFDPDDMRMAGCKVYPCTILIAEKHLRGDK